MGGLDSSFTRFEIEKAVDEGGLQYVTGRGLFGERFEKVLRAEPHGFASHPPAGSVGLALPMGGRRDQIAIFGVEHPKHRPADIPAGKAVLYDDKGQVVFFKDDRIAIHSKQDVIHIAVGPLRVVMAEKQYVQMKVKSNDDPDDGETTLMHLTLNFAEGKIQASHPIEIAADPKPEY